jgi:hypothetical protein
MAHDHVLPVALPGLWCGPLILIAGAFLRVFEEEHYGI